MASGVLEAWTLKRVQGDEPGGSSVLRHHRLGAHRLGGQDRLLRAALERRGELPGFFAIAAADRLELRQIALGLLDRALLEQSLALTRDRGEIVRVALDRKSTR